jgi:hypothetical protein
MCVLLPSGAIQISQDLPIDNGLSTSEGSMLRTLPPKSKIEKNVGVVIDALRRRKRLERSEATVRHLVKEDLESGTSVEDVISERISEYERFQKNKDTPEVLHGTPPEPSAPSWRAIITRRMRECGWNCNRLGGACGVNRTVLYRFVRGETSLTLDTAEKVCALLHLRLVPTENVHGSSPRGALNQRHNRAPRLRQRGVMK